MFQKIKPYILILPAVLVMMTLFLGGLALGFLQSLGLFSIIGNSHITFDFYKELLRSVDFKKSIVLTFEISVISATASGVFAMILTYILFIIEENKLSKILRRLFQLPILVPHITAAYLIGLLLMKSGWISSITYYLGITKSMEAFPSIINNINSIGIITTYMWKEVPFIILMLVPALQRIETSWLEIARVFGSTRKEFFNEVVYPLIMPTWISSMLIVFAFTFSDFEVPYLLGVTYPKLAAVFAYDIYINGDLIIRPLALAANFMLTIITAILGILAYKIIKKWDIKKQMRW
ncbi:ABC transporter permease [Candidatus Clostridium stratigraminis]|uniref:ABC transporter permease n=1 Tax=Candidatus Clostridium stratigraminis TaxID=3381661 RepID=A0ABW8SZI2_9CLOT